MNEHETQSSHGAGDLIHHPVGGLVESQHPTASVYIVIAVILTIFTVAEIGVYYVSALQSILVPLLIFLALCKFILVAAYYMHLHFDDRVFSVLFIFPLMLACLILASLTMLFGSLATRPGP
jgi:cytochrome c oxidase subunit 4